MNLKLSSPFTFSTKDGKVVFPIEQVLLVLLVFAVCLVGALLVPMGQCPDETGRAKLSTWIAQTGTLPIGDEPEVLIRGWGFSYALRPYLPAIISSMFIRLASLFTGSEQLLLFAARLTSVISATACCVFLLLTGNRLFRRGSATLFAAVVCLLPQVVFLGMYQNNDIAALAGVCAMLYFCVVGYDEHWPIWSCVGLGVGASVVALSYYVAYGWMLAAMAFFAISLATCNKGKGKRAFVLQRVGIVVGVLLLLSGWFFVRNALIHNGDMFGMASEVASRNRLAAQGVELYEYVSFRDQGRSFIECLAYERFQMLWLTGISFVGVFGFMLIYLPIPLYIIYFAIFLLGILAYVVAVVRKRPEQRDAMIAALTIVASAIALALHFWATYARDYQPQGRYVITVIVMIAYLLAYGMDNVFKKPRPAHLLAVVWLVLFFVSYFGTMTRMFA